MIVQMLTNSSSVTEVQFYYFSSLRVFSLEIVNTKFIRVSWCNCYKDKKLSVIYNGRSTKPKVQSSSDTSVAVGQTLNTHFSWE